MLYAPSNPTLTRKVVLWLYILHISRLVDSQFSMCVKLVTMAATFRMVARLTQANKGWLDDVNDTVTPNSGSREPRDSNQGAI